jgi:serine protease AprX
MGETARTVWCNGRRVVVSEGLFEEHGQPRTLARFTGPILREWRDVLARAGIAVVAWAPPYGAVLQLPAGFTVASLRSFGFVAGAIGYGEDLCQRELPESGANHRHATGLMPEMVDLVCFDRPSRERVAAALAERGIEILAASSVKLRVRFFGDLAELRALDGVKLVDPARAPVPLADTHVAPSSVSNGLPASVALDGAGQIVAIADTGLDSGVVDSSMHADFAGRIVSLTPWPLNPSWVPIVTGPGTCGPDLASGHGTHVAGLALGGGPYRGAAPAAKLVFQALEHRCDVRPEYAARIASGYYLAGRPLDLRELFGQARDLGAHIHVNAWGDPASGAYTDDCYEADLFLHEHPDALVLFAAGNDGTDRNGDGMLETGSLYAPASAKNVVTIGAAEGPITGRGLRRTWGQLDSSGARWRNLNDRSAMVSGTPNRIACFSSTGPTRDGRVKPDLCATGTNVVAARSRRAVGLGWGLADPLPLYMFNGGTSAATGVAGGLVAVLRQAWTAEMNGVPPSGFALKALLIAGAAPMRGRGGRSTAQPHEAGHGLIDLPASLPAGTRLLADQMAGVETGESETHTITLPTVAHLRAVLAWYDAPGEVLVNDLDLTLATAEGSVLAGRTPDRVNTVERVEAILPAGTYRLVATGHNVPAGPQPYALAIRIQPLT